jgi:hypothetical protein
VSDIVIASNYVIEALNRMLTLETGDSRPLNANHDLLTAKPACLGF